MTIQPPHTTQPLAWPKKLSFPKFIARRSDKGLKQHSLLQHKTMTAGDESRDRHRSPRATNDAGGRESWRALAPTHLLLATYYIRDGGSVSQEQDYFFHVNNFVIHVAVPFFNLFSLCTPDALWGFWKDSWVFCRNMSAASLGFYCLLLWGCGKRRVIGVMGRGEKGGGRRALYVWWWWVWVMRVSGI